MVDILTPEQVAAIKANIRDQYAPTITRNLVLDLVAAYEALREQLAEAETAIRGILACLAQPHSTRPDWHVAKGQARAFQDAVQRAREAVKEGKVKER